MLDMIPRPAMLARLAARQLRSHPWQLGLAILGIALGVAVAVSIDLANGSALRAFALATEAVSGRATHQILGGPSGLPDDLYRRLRVDVGVRRAAPIVEGDVAVADRVVDVAAADRAGDTPRAGRVGQALPAGADLVSAGATAGATARMIMAFQWNLAALSLLALVVGMFLIYQTMTFSVVQRRPLIGSLRALGVTRGEIFALVMSEALVIGIAGTLLGVGLGFGMAQGLLRLVTRTINDLYFVLSVREVALDPVTLAKSVLLGIGATALAALPPALEATAAPPRIVMSRASLESSARRRAHRAGWLGLVALAAPTSTSQHRAWSAAAPTPRWIPSSSCTWPRRRASRAPAPRAASWCRARAARRRWSHSTWILYGRRAGAFATAAPPASGTATPSSSPSPSPIATACVPAPPCACAPIRASRTSAWPASSTTTAPAPASWS